MRTYALYAAPALVIVGFWCYVLHAIASQVQR